MFEDIIRTEIRMDRNRMMISIPAVITNIPNNLEDMRVDVQPSVNTLLKDGSSEEQPQILGVPVVMPGAGNSLINIPLNVGDTVLLVFCHRNIDNFKIGNGLPTTPPDLRKMDAQDAVAIAGLYPFSKSLNRPAIRKYAHNTKDLSITHNVGTASECEFRLTQTGQIFVRTSNDITVQGQNVNVQSTGTLTVQAPNTVWTGNMQFNGTFMLGAINLNTHKHPGVQTGAGTTQGPI